MGLTVASRFNCNGMGMCAIFTSFCIFKTASPTTTFMFVTTIHQSIESVLVKAVG